jgi:hypothetical protein
MSTEKGQMEELMQAWFALSEEMGKQWSEMAGTPNKDVRDVFQTWTDLSAEMGRGMLDLMGGSAGAYAGVRDTWSEWSDRIARQLSRARSSGPDMTDLSGLQETWARNSMRISKLLTEQMSRGVTDRMEGVAKAAEAVGRAVTPMAGKGAQDVTELTTVMARYWADNYAKVMGSTQAILEEEGDLPSKARKVNDAWFAFSSDMMKEVMRTAAFSRWMGGIRDTDLDIQRKTRDMTEEGLRGMGMPTRTDIEEVQRSLKDVQMELRALRQRVEGRPGRERASERTATARKGPAKRGAGTRGKGAEGRGAKGRGARR